MTLWQQFIEPDEKHFLAMHFHASPSNIESEITQEVVAARAEATIKVLHKWDVKLSVQISKELIGIPKKSFFER